MIQANLGKVNRVDAIFEALEKANPHPSGELNWTNPFTLLVAVVLSAQTTDKGVNKATDMLFKLADTPEKMAALGVEGIKTHIKTIGLFNAKAKNVFALSEKLIAQHEGQVPSDITVLQTLPGVGRKTANVVANIAFGQPTIAVDTHVFRLSHRLNLSKGKTPDAVEQDLLKKVPKRFLQHAHHWLILHGRYVCTARAPKCEKCIIFDLCHSKDKRKL